MSSSRSAGQTGPRVIVARSEAREFDAFLPPGTIDLLRALGSFEAVGDDGLRPPRIGRTLAGARVLVTDWEFPVLDARFLDAAPRLELVAHTGSAVGRLVTDSVWERGIRVTQAGAAMTRPVAELSLTLTLALLRDLARQDHALHAGDDWDRARIRRPREILGARIGVLGAGRIGRTYIELVRALDAEVRVHDPYIAADDPLAASRADLDELLPWCDVLALHAPDTPATRGLIGAPELKTMHDGAAVVNTARSALVDDDALFAEVESGRLDAALDVYPTEPLPADSRWRRLPNALLAAHLGGATAASRARAGRILVEEIRRHITGEPLLHEVTAGDLGRVA